eukprot:jgi/Orpsp1_1/1183764/evm.model.c7180000086646.1
MMMIIKFCYSGFKFEALSTIPIPPEEINNSKENMALLDERINSVVNNKEEYGIIVKSNLNNLRLIMGAEVDCAEKRFSQNDMQKPYVELKSTKVLNNSKDEMSFERYKLLKFWAQSYLVGIPKIIIAFRDNDLKVQKVTSMKTLNIPHVVNQHQKERNQNLRMEQIHDISKDSNKGHHFIKKKYFNESWNANVCLAFAEQFLNWLKYTVLVKSDPTTSYTITFDSEINKNIINVKCNGPNSGFLPDWWIN